MFDIALNRLDGDLVLKKNDRGFHELLFIDGRDRIAQKIKITLQEWLGEWFLDRRKGTPYLEVILKKNVRLSSVESILRARILSVQGVQRITQFNMEFNNRTRSLRLDFTCTSSEGTVKDSFLLDALR